MRREGVTGVLCRCCYQLVPSRRLLVREYGSLSPPHVRDDLREPGARAARPRQVHRGAMRLLPGVQPVPHSAPGRATVASTIALLLREPPNPAIRPVVTGAIRAQPQ